VAFLPLQQELCDSDGTIHILSLLPPRRVAWFVERGDQMNKLLPVVVATLAFFAASGAKAADAALPMKASPTPIEPPFSWTGFYLGANGGGGSAWSHSRVTQATPFGPTSFCCGFGLAGGILGGQAGFNYEFPSHWLIGIEGDGDWAQISRSSSGCPIFTGGPFTGFTAGCATNNVTLNSFETVRGRLGYAFNTGSSFSPSVLLYGTGGWAWGQLSGNSTTTCLGVFCPGASVPFTGGGASFNDTANGWTAGAGLEIAFARHWTARFEFLHLQFNNVGTSFSTITASPVLGTGTATTHISSNVNVDVVRIGVNYLFN
jgi:outer membrane immunogenic protein